MDKTHRPIDIYQKVVEFIDNDRSFSVGLILNAEGSTPRKAGVRAIIDQSGKIEGTLGGGIVEAKAQRHAVEACQSGKPLVFDLELHGVDTVDDVPICGGKMRILIDPKAAKDKATFIQAADAVRRRQRGVMLTTIRHAKQTEVTYQWYPQEDEPSVAAFPGIQNIRSCLDCETARLFTESSPKSSDLTEVFVEPVIPKPLLLIAGAGHVGQAVAIQASLVGFDVAVMDERSEFTDPVLFPEGTRTYCGDIAKQISARIENDTYAVIVTRGHQLDAEVLQACIHSRAIYVGMIGSKRKVTLMRRHFIESGLATEEEFDRVFAPIGLDIGAVTVPEIAASITAELIAVRRKGIVHEISGKETMS